MPRERNGKEPRFLWKVGTSFLSCIPRCPPGVGSAFSNSHLHFWKYSSEYGVQVSFILPSRNCSCASILGQIPSTLLERASHECQIYSALWSFWCLKRTELCLKNFPQSNTLIRLLTSVNPVMFTKVCILPEGFLTLTTFYRGFSPVSSVMFREMCCEQRAFPTFLTFIKGYSPVWILICWVRQVFWLSPFHISFAFMGFLQCDFSGSLGIRRKCSEWKLYHIHCICRVFLPVWILWCLVSGVLWAKALPHSLHLYGFLQYESLVFNKGWRIYSQKAFPHSLHFRVSLSMNSLMLRRFAFVWKVFPHSSHLYGFSPVWILWCCVRFECLRKEEATFICIVRFLTSVRFSDEWGVCSDWRPSPHLLHL